MNLKNVTLAASLFALLDFFDSLLGLALAIFGDELEYYLNFASMSIAFSSYVMGSPVLGFMLDILAKGGLAAFLLVLYFKLKKGSTPDVKATTSTQNLPPIKRG